MAKATPDVRRHNYLDEMHEQIRSVVKPAKMYGANSNKNYDKSPARYHNEVLEKRVFNMHTTTPSSKKRA